MSKFYQGNTVYWHDNNKPVTIVKLYPCKPKDEPVYLVRSHENDLQFNVPEKYLYPTQETFPDALFRIGEKVYFYTRSKGIEPTEYIIKDIYRDDNVSDEILYKCVDYDGNEKEFSHWNLTLYDFAYVSR